MLTSDRNEIAIEFKKDEINYVFLDKITTAFERLKFIISDSRAKEVYSNRLITILKIEEEN